MKLLNWSLDILASLMVILIVWIFMIFRKQNDYMAEHAGWPRQGADPVRITLLLAGSFLIWRIWG